MGTPRSRFISWLIDRTPGQLKAIGAGAGLLLAQGAPVGLLLHTYLWGAELAPSWLQHIERSLTEQFSTYLYVWMGTSFYFSAFGYAMAWFTAVYLRQLQRSRSALSLFARFDEMKKNLREHIHVQLNSPVASLVEFSEGLNSGLFGQFSQDQLQTLSVFLEEVIASHRAAAGRLHSSGPGVTLRSTLSPLATQMTLQDHESQSWDTRLTIDEELLRNALREVFATLKPGTRARLTTNLSAEITSQWPTEDYFVFCVEGAGSESHVAESWAIVRHVLEWFNGGFWQVDGRDQLYFAIPKVESKSKGARAA